MLHCAHKDLLLELARQHSRELREQLTFVRVTLGATHLRAGEIVRRLEVANAAVQELEAERVGVAA